MTELWPAVARRVSSELGLTVALVERLARQRHERVTWLADAGPAGPVIVKARPAGDRADEKTPWVAAALPLLAARGYPVPEILWHGLLDDDWHVVVLERTSSPTEARSPSSTGMRWGSTAAQPT